MIDKNRLSAITDGIIAVAATVMVLRLDIPEQLSAEAVRERIPTLIAYVISYAQIFLAWHEHHDSFVNAKRINHRIFLVNTLWLFLITMLPFATGAVGISPGHTPTVLLFIAVIAMQVLVQSLESRMIEKFNGEKIQDADIIRKVRIVTLVGCGSAAVIAFFAPRLSIGVVVLSSLVSVVMICAYDHIMQQCN